MRLGSVRAATSATQVLSFECLTYAGAAVAVLINQISLACENLRQLMQYLMTAPGRQTRAQNISGIVAGLSCAVILMLTSPVCRLPFWKLENSTPRKKKKPRIAARL